ncbi:hypothetical protein KC331_g851 [Hortaea werneckii]|nr:hypothetical protein KC331_g851 [Hortaea werneckii]KAI7722336.1 hypothetical protein KC353_g582 [Hortaea werneckii]
MSSQGSLHPVLFTSQISLHCTNDTTRMGFQRHVRRIDAYRPQHVSDTEDSGSSGRPELASDAFDLQAWNDANTFAPGTQIQRSPSPALASKRTLKADGVPSSPLSPNDVEMKQEAHRAYQALISDNKLMQTATELRQLYEGCEGEWTL